MQLKVRIHRVFQKIPTHVTAAAACRISVVKGGGDGGGKYFSDVLYICQNKDTQSPFVMIDKRKASVYYSVSNEASGHVSMIMRLILK